MQRTFFTAVIAVLAAFFAYGEMARIVGVKPE